MSEMLLAILLCVATADAPDCAAAVPGLIPAAQSQNAVPIWVSAREAEAKDGSIRWDLFDSSDQASLQRHARAQSRRPVAGSSTASPANRCTEYFGGYETARSNVKNVDTFADLARSSEGAYRGTVTAIEPGFFKGLPGALLRLRVDAAVRESAAYPHADLYLFHPYKTFAVGNQLFCTGSTYEPRVGDRVLTFGLYAPQDSLGSVIFPEAQEYFFEDSEGVLHVPPRWRNDAAVGRARSLIDLENTARRDAVRPRERQ